MSAVHEPLRYAHDEGHTDVCYTEDGTKFITCGADGDIRIWSTNDSEDPIHNCIGEWALSVRLRGNNVYVATSSNDIQILSLPEGDRDGVLDRFVAPINHIAVAKGGKLIALAGEDMEVKLINLERTNKEVTVFNGLAGPCLSVAICPQSKILAASSGDTMLRLWNIESNELLKEISCFPKVNSFSNAKILCRIDFDPVRGNHLAYPDKSNVVIININNWSEKSNLTCDEISTSFSIVQYSPGGQHILATTEEGDFVIWEISSETVVSLSKHQKSIGICGLMWNPKGNGEIVYTDIEGQLGRISNAVKIDSVLEIEPVPIEDGACSEDVDFEEVMFDDDEDNENAISVEKLKRECLGSPESEFKNLDDDSLHVPTPRPRTPETPLQSPFMPSSTPDHLDPRYLCWNDIGIIRSYGGVADESASKSIEVEFHDSTFHNSMMMQNYQEYTMGSLSKAALAVANSSQVNVIPLAASSKEWLLKVEEHEEIVVIAVSENLVCFAMANYIVRICSVFGTQRAVVALPGSIVTMVAFKNVLMVAYHSGSVRKGDQCINIRLIKFEGSSIDSKDIGSALGPESTLMWLGFSDVGTPAMMDSLGMLSLYPHNSNIWIPFCDTNRHSKSLSDGFFVTAVFESYQAVGGIKCKGSMYPGFAPRPTMCELPLEPPFAEATTEKTQMEMNLFTWSMLQVSDTDKKYKETALKTFALACKNDLEQRALEFMEILANPQILTLGLKYASKLDKRRLVGKLMDLATKLSDETDDLGVQEIATPEPTNVKPVYRKLSLSAAKYSRNKSQRTQEVSTPNVSQKSEKSDIVTPSNTDYNVEAPNESTLNTQESLFHEEEPKNPFLKSLKKSTVNITTNPLSLTDKSAGVVFEKENKSRNGEAREKRKLSDCENTKQKEKQRKLDSFRFTKHS
ncbi:WD repeat and HMG-box DNA-binding protein 1 [Anoplophora glabripennis]|uniref:WD repeat and HMG-box DNA-binding protein 1 n=1 Tax=Anoplophora glabripennis TaxID=217634 RepID=UPI0008757FEC|nr:WD repeat and HMG-box DNA-binding protein 1 [Anoplophora glabripennis]